MNARRFGTVFRRNAESAQRAQAVVRVAADRAMSQSHGPAPPEHRTFNHSKSLFEIRTTRHARRCSNIRQRSMSFRAGLARLLVR
jgi:hypothetical protein